VKVTVEDVHGGLVIEEFIIEIWNDAVVSDIIIAGVIMDYSIIYFSKAVFLVDVEDGDIMICNLITLPDFSGGVFSGVYIFVVVIEYSLVIIYVVNDVLVYSMDIVFDFGLGVFFLWFIINCKSVILI
jgi:hypothetical protein